VFSANELGPYWTCIELSGHDTICWSRVASLDGFLWNLWQRCGLTGSPRYDSALHAPPRLTTYPPLASGPAAGHRETTAMRQKRLGSPPPSGPSVRGDRQNPPRAESAVAKLPGGRSAAFGSSLWFMAAAFSEPPKARNHHVRPIHARRSARADHRAKVDGWKFWILERAERRWALR
jgi:hypothetical protein